MKSTALRYAVVAAAATLLGSVGILSVTATSAYADTATPDSKATQESAGQRVEDAMITTKVKSAFVQDDKIKAMSIHVTTDNGIVQLSGFANSSQEADHAADVARQVSGVKDVTNDIKLKQ
ncbi:MAG: BON domain-containing protein [Rhodocyclaceae bacterium]|nr:BON domain-containing protein [Rhodocyclaceae bacterium]